MVFNGTGFAGSHDCGNFSGSMALLNANGDVVSAMLITNFGREEVAFKHVDYIICRRKFYQTKAAFFVTERVYRQLLKYYFSVFFLTIM
jgi:hypothetical protein